MPTRLFVGIVTGLLAAVFLIDLQTPLGSAEWVLYLVPCAACLFSREPRLPLAIAAISSLLMVLGFLNSPPGLDPSAAAVNRSMGALAVWLVSVAAYLVLRDRERLRQFAWVQAGESKLAEDLRGEQAPEAVAAAVLNTLVRYVDARVGVLYRLEGGRLLRMAVWGAPEDRLPGDRLSLAAAGLLGEALRDRRMLVAAGLPSGHLQVVSTLGRSVPENVIAVPLTAEGAVIGAIELGFIAAATSTREVSALLEQSAEMIGMALRAALDRQRLQELLEETQRQSEELQAQQEELERNFEELEAQSQELRSSQERLELQQVELEQSNRNLEEVAADLDAQRQALLTAQLRLTENADLLERANRYKSEFLANMSHELRTPLNSSMILAKLLAENRTGTLSAEQVRYAQSIHSTNTELLSLINDILDLAKIEAGRLDVQAEEIMIATMFDEVDMTFRPLAMQKNLTLSFETAPAVPRSFVSDRRCVHQILRNLLSNALKFTERGQIRVRAVPAGDGRLAFEVEDSGIGIPASQQEVIFEAFMQADGTTARKYGGTGLGLSICRQLAGALEGTIEVNSEPGRGSCFRLTLPLLIEGRTVQSPPQWRSRPTSQPIPLPVSQPSMAIGPMASATAAEEEASVDQARGERMILIVEDDPPFARILQDLVRELDFDAVLAATAADALNLARKMRPCGILLDMGLPDDSGLTVLDRLKQDPRTRHIPVHIVSVNDHAQTALQLGAIGYTFKPTAREDLEQVILGLTRRMDRRLRRLLLVEDDVTLRETLTLLLRGSDVEIVGAGTMAEALDQLSGAPFDCVVMDLSLPDGSGYDLLRQMSESGRHAFPPVIVYTGRSLSEADEGELRRLSKSIIIKGAKSPERLLSEVTLFLHSVEADLAPDQQTMLREVRQRDSAFENRRVLLAEDDVRNVFALSQVIEPLGARLEIARNGREAVEMLDREPGYDLVLMDVMMPEMDGISAMQAIRARPELAKLPIIALTAKAMPEDRQRCLDAGASDYIAKPIDVDKLLSLCRVWLHR
ncbi:MAG TPA: response regulator [Fontimonas sp.]